MENNYTIFVKYLSLFRLISTPRSTRSADL